MADIKWNFQTLQWQALHSGSWISTLGTPLRCEQDSAKIILLVHRSMSSKEQMLSLLLLAIWRQKWATTVYFYIGLLLERSDPGLWRYLILSIFYFFFFLVLVLARYFVLVILPTNFSFVCLFVVEVGVVSTGKRINDKNNKKTH